MTLPSRFPIRARLAALAATLAAAVCSVANAQVRIENTARIDVTTTDGRALSVASNTVSLDRSLLKRPTKLSIDLLPVGYMPSGWRCETSPKIQFIPAPIDPETLAAAPRMETFDIHEPVIIVLDADNSNRDPTVRETLWVDVGTGRLDFKLPLLETAANTGVFAGAVPAVDDQAEPEHAACSLHLRRGDTLSLSFAENDHSFASKFSVLIDPAGYVFDSSNGTLIDGATVRLLDDSGNPATVFGDDGVSAYPSTVISGAEVRDASGRVYPGTPGHYRFPLAAPGHYRIKVEPPKSHVAPSTAPRDEVRKLTDPAGAPFILIDASWGATFELKDPDPVYADIPVDPILRAFSGETMLLTKTASVRDASPGDFVQYRVTGSNRGTTALPPTVIEDVLPAGLRYERGSTRGTAEPQVASDARTLRFPFPALAANQSTEITYVVSIAPGAPKGEALNRVRVAAPSRVTSNEAAASVRIRPLLFTDAMTIIGRVTEGGCNDPAAKRRGVAGVRVVLQDGTFVITDRDGLYHFEGVRPGTHVVQMDRTSIPDTHDAVACDVDTRQARNPVSRFVEGVGGVLKRVDFQLRPNGKRAAAADTLPVAVADDATAAGSRDWLAGLTPGTDWVFPDVDHNPRAPSLRVVIKHRPDQRVALSVNGEQSDPLAFDGSDADGARGVAITRWSNLSIGPGANRLTARVLDADGRIAATLERTVTMSGPGVRATFDQAKSRLVADGSTRPLVAVRVTDKDGRPVRAGTLVPFRVDQPYRAAIDVATEQGRQFAGGKPAEATARVVGDDGYAFLPIEPTTVAGALRLDVLLSEEKQVRRSEVNAWLSAAARGWTVVGFGKGTIGYDTLSRRASALPRSERDRVVTDGQLALYAKGRVKGSWLLTLAYDSDRAYDPDRGLLGVIDPDRYYTVYGDGTVQGYDAPTRRKLYLRLERREFYALFGDFETGLTATQLTRYSRTLNGVKAAYQSRRIRFDGFAATTDTRYSRDEIQGNGLSGPYRLGGRNIVPNSDKVRVETRDRFRSERIVATRQLTRHIDYDIDATRGTLRFREPVLSRDSGLNPNFIVVDYEVDNGRASKFVAAGRAAAKLADGRVELGAGAIRDNTQGHATVLGADLRARLARDTEVRGEVATGGRGGLGDGLAYLAEVEHHGGGIDLLGYVRRQDADFGVGQQNIVEAATSKVGLDGRIQLTDRLSLTGTGWYQDMLGGPASRIASDLRLELRRATGTVFVGGQFAADRGGDGGDRDSRLLTLGGSQALFDGKLTLAAQTQVAPGGDKASVDFPARHQLTASWKVKPGIRLISGYEIAEGQDFTAHTAQIGFDVAPWRGAKLMSTLNQQALGGGENGGRTYAQYGLSQSLPLGRHWTVDATLDASSTVRGAIPAGGVINAFQPVASGGFIGQDQLNGDYAAVTLGATYRAASWTWNGRVEHRSGDAGTRWGLTTNALRSLGEGKTLAGGLRAYTLRDERGARATYATADIALAWRPLDSRWSLLDRFELRHDRADAGFTSNNVLGVPASGRIDEVTTRFINNLALNFRNGAEGVGHGVEATLYYGSKYVVGRYDRQEYTGYVDATGAEVRVDLSSRVDLGMQASVQHAWDRGAWSLSAGPSVGLSPAKDVWVTAGYNVAGYRDREFEDDRYTRRGAYLTVRMKFDELGLGAAARRLMGRR